MQPIPNLFGRASAVEADHARLRETWTRLRELVAATHQHGEPHAELWPLVREFSRELREHFSAEEAGGYFAALTEQRPELGAQIERLRGEHREILALSAGLESSSPGWDAGLGSQLRRLLDRFQQHERAEAKMLQDFFGRDQGGEGSE
jgi:hypothetical protein